MTASIADMAEAVAAELQDPARWTKDVYARNIAGDDVEPNDTTAVCWCPEGQCIRLYGWEALQRLDRAFLAFARKSISSVNDGSGRTQVMQWLRELAIRERRHLLTNG